MKSNKPCMAQSALLQLQLCFIASYELEQILHQSTTRPTRPSRTTQFVRKDRAAFGRKWTWSRVTVITNLSLYSLHHVSQPVAQPTPTTIMRKSWPHRQTSAHDIHQVLQFTPPAALRNLGRSEVSRVLATGWLMPSSRRSVLTECPTTMLLLRSTLICIVIRQERQSLMLSVCTKHVRWQEGDP